MGKISLGNVSQGYLRVNTRSSQPRTSSNLTFQEHLHRGMGQGLDMAGQAIGHIAPRVPVISSSFRKAAENLSSSNLGRAGLDTGDSMLESDLNSMPDTMLKNNKDMLEQQLRVSQITTSYSTKSYIIKALFEALKTIGSNIR